MYRSDWELTSYVRHRLADLADEHPTRGQIDWDLSGAARLLSEVRQRLGIGLIRAGHALAGSDTGGVLPTPPTRPTPWGHPG